MSMDDIGPRGFIDGVGVASLAFTPMVDRAAIIRKIKIDDVSATDNWVLTCGPSDVGEYYIRNDGYQQLLGGASSVYPKAKDLFDMLRHIDGPELVYPVPQGMTFTIASAGGATADIAIEYSEEVPATVTPSLPNHPKGSRWIAPLYFQRAAAVTAAGEQTFDTQRGVSFVPPIDTDVPLPQGWKIKILCMFLQAAGINTYSGAADHQSRSTYFALRKNGKLYFTRANSGGIPLEGAASAAGSANKVYDHRLNPFPPFQVSDDYDWDYFPTPMVVNGGDNLRWRLNVTGDVTGGADYSGAVQVMVCEIQELNP